MLASLTKHDMSKALIFTFRCLSSGQNIDGSKTNIHWRSKVLMVWWYLIGSHTAAGLSQILSGFTCWYQRLVWCEITGSCCVANLRIRPCWDMSHTCELAATSGKLLYIPTGKIKALYSPGSKIPENERKWTAYWFKWTRKNNSIQMVLSKMQ